MLAFQPVTDDDQDHAPEEPARDECPCPKPDDQYLLEVDAGQVFLTHRPCGKPPRNSEDFVENLQLNPTPVQIQPDHNCTSWDCPATDCHVWLQVTIPGLPEQTATAEEPTP
ncbi:hypothetical protein ACFW2X_06585 [Streptomyces antibioticus]|uniref:hypothetical protein n=1 Tax=Streptomyces antibioticus TaxID=1890 RepID=UPI0036B8C62F